MSVKGQNAFRGRIYLLAFSSWTELSGKEQTFIVAVIENDRQAYVDFVVQKTVMGRLRYTLHYPRLLIAMFHLIEAIDRVAGTSLNHLAMSVLISFNFRQKVSSIGDYISKGYPMAEEVLILSGKTKIKDDYNG